MIQFRRGTANHWKNTPLILASGQPGYDKTKKKLKIGDGKSPWSKLPFVSGLFKEEILDSEANAKDRNSKDKTDLTLFTYGTTLPDEKTIGEVYLQHYAAEPETDYVIAQGTNRGWQYQKWHSGKAKCWATQTVSTAIKSKIEGTNLYFTTSAIQYNYPFTFVAVPTETAIAQANTGIIWLANKGENSTTQSGKYTILSTDRLESTQYKINLVVEGRWR